MHCPKLLIILAVQHTDQYRLISLFFCLILIPDPTIGSRLILLRRHPSVIGPLLRGWAYMLARAHLGIAAASHVLTPKSSPILCLY